MLIDRSIPYDLGGDSNVSYEPTGVVGRFRVPAQFVSIRTEVPSSEAAFDHSDQLSDFSGIGVLVVEDQLLIAIEVEEILTKAGFDMLATVTSPREGLQFLRERRPDIAVLDVNLGEETSEAIADALADRGIPFVFSTGYGNDAIPAQHIHVPVVRKPYTAGTLLPRLNALLKQ
jgi:CheY-like chemotaxis protein